MTNIESQRMYKFYEQDLIRTPTGEVAIIKEIDRCIVMGTSLVRELIPIDRISRWDYGYVNKYCQRVQPGTLTPRERLILVLRGVALPK